MIWGVYKLMQFDGRRGSLQQKLPTTTLRLGGEAWEDIPNVPEPKKPCLGLSLREVGRLSHHVPPCTLRIASFWDFFWPWERCGNTVWIMDILIWCPFRTSAGGLTGTIEELKHAPNLAPHLIPLRTYGMHPRTSFCNIENHPSCFSKKWSLQTALQATCKHRRTGVRRSGSNDSCPCLLGCIHVFLRNTDFETSCSFD